MMCLKTAGTTRLDVFPSAMGGELVSSRAPILLTKSIMNVLGAAPVIEFVHSSFHLQARARTGRQNTH